MQGTSNTAHYNNLPPGRYRFTVRGSNDDGVWAGDIASIDILVRQPLYKSTTALIGYLLAASLTVWFVTRYVRQRHSRRMAEFATRQEQAAARSKIDFFTNIAHEIRTPLSLIKVPLESVLSSGERFSPRTENYLRVMDRNTAALLEMVNQLLDLRKTEHLIADLSLERIDVSTLLDDACECFRPMLEVSGIALQHDIPSAMFFDADRDALSKIVHNLLSNATKYAAAQVAVGLADAGDHFTITVFNDGENIQGTDGERIFEAF